MCASLSSCGCAALRSQLVEHIIAYSYSASVDSWQIHDTWHGTGGGRHVARVLFAFARGSPESAGDVLVLFPQWRL